MSLSLSDELAAYTFTRGDTEFIHQHEVDARGASEDLSEAKPIRVFFSLAGLYLLIEKGYSGWQVQAAHGQMAREKRDWPRFAAPAVPPSLTTADVMREPQGSARDEAILRWCGAVWETWSHEHSRVRQATDELLAGWFPPTKPGRPVASTNPATHHMRLHPGPFSDMRAGTKKSELRINDEKRRLIKVGDTIEFTSRSEGAPKLMAQVAYLKTYPTFETLYEGAKEDYPDWSRDSFLRDMREYYTPEEEKTYGALEIGIELL